MGQTQELINNYKEIRQRLRNPVNAIPDKGINLHRIPLTELSSKEIQAALEYPNPIHCRVTVEIIPAPPPKPVAPRRLALLAIEKAVCLHYKVAQKVIRGRSKAVWIVIPRQTMFYLACKHTGLSLPQIGRLYKRDHSTVLHGKKKISELILVDSTVAESVDLLEQRLFRESALNENNKAAVPSLDQRDVCQQIGTGEKPLPLSGIQSVDSPSGVDAEHAETPAI